MIPQSVRWRLTLWYAATLAVGLLVFAVSSYALLARVLDARADRFITDARKAFIVELGVEASEMPTTDAAIKMAISEVRFEETRFLVFAPNARLVAASAALGADLSTVDSKSVATDSVVPAPVEAKVLHDQVQDFQQRGDSAPKLLTVVDSSDAFRVQLGAVPVNGVMHTVMAVHDRREQKEILNGVATAYALAVPLLLLCAGGGGYLLARRALAPVTEMGRRARAMNAETLHERLPVGNANDELGELAALINSLLERIESAFDQQRRFVADASHELRTPVAIVRAEADVALEKPTRHEAEYRDAFKVVRGASERLSGIVEDLFLLARADAGNVHLVKEPLYLDELIADTVRALREVAAKRSVTMLVAVSTDLSDAPYSGSPALLDRMLLNLLDNAIKFSPENGIVRVRLSHENESYVLRVDDTGPGIPADAHAHIFERFYRVNRARSSEQHISNGARVLSTSGAGLGLAIARWIAEVHGGELQLEATSPAGSTFIATLPWIPSQ